MSETSASWAKAGIHDESGFCSLLYNRPSNRLIAHMYRIEGGQPFRRLYTRRPEDEAYALLGENEPGISLEYPVTTPTKPFLYVLVCEAVKYREGYRGFNPLEIRKFELTTGTIVGQSRCDDLAVRPPYQRLWVASLVGLDDEDILFCNIGMQRTDQAGHEPVDYFLCQLRFESRTCTTITELLEVFL